MLDAFRGHFGSFSRADLRAVAPCLFGPRLVIEIRERRRWKFAHTITVGALGLLAVALVVSGKPALALTPGASLSQYIYRSWRTADGLPSGAILAFAQSTGGYLWMGTQEGLVRFDGVRFTVFDSANTPEIRNNSIMALAPSHDGGVWIGTEGGGLLRWADGAFSVWSIVDGFPRLKIRSLLEDHLHNLWIGTEDGGLAMLKGGRIKVYTKRDGLPGNTIWSLAEGGDGSIWIGTDRYGLSHLKDGTFATLTAKDGLPSNGILSLCADASGGLWVGTAGAGLAYLRGGKSTHYGSRDGLPGLTISSILLDKSGTLWVGTQEGGIGRSKNGAFETCGTTQGLADNLVLALAEDHEGSLWVGTVNGLTQFVDSDFVTYTKDQGLPSNTVLCTYEDRIGNLWAGTVDGVAEIPKSGPIKSYSPHNGLPGSMILAVHGDPAGDLWFGIQGHGIARLQHGRFERVTMRDGLICNNVSGFCDANDGGLWVGTPSGLSLIQGGTITNYTLNNGSGTEGVMALASGRDGSLWVGTNTGTLNRFKDGAWTTFGPKYGSPAVRVTGLHSIYEDQEGTLWIGSADGLVRFKDGKSAVFARKDGLFHDFIYQVLEDDRGRLWITCNRGVFVVSKSVLDRVANGSTERITCRVYDTSDGMKSAECNGGGAPAGVRRRDGRLCFPTMMGVAVIDPAQVPVNAAPPSTAIEGIKADGEPMPLVQGLSLHAGVRHIEFQYTALSFRAPEKIAFRYKLLGYDKDWIEAGTHREAFYTNLRPGDYSFSVAARSRDGVWGTTIPALRLTVQPFFYQTKTFIVLCSLAALGTAFAANRLVIAQLRARNAVLHERTRIARDIHDTVAQGLTGVVLQLDTVERLIAARPTDALGHLARARELLGANLDETRRAIGALRSHLLEQEDLPSALRRLGESMTKGSAIKFSVNVEGRIRHLRDKAAEEDLWKIAQEAIVNALRHGKGGHIEVSLYYSSSALRITVRDDGPGFAPPIGAVGDSHGLLGMRERGKARGWDLDIMSAPGLGTTVSVTVPMPRWPIRWTA